MVVNRQFSRSVFDVLLFGMLCPKKHSDITDIKAQSARFYFRLCFYEHKNILQSYLTSVYKCCHGENQQG